MTHTFTDTDREWMLRGIPDRERLESAKSVTFVFEEHGRLFSCGMKHIPREWIELSTCSDGKTLQARIRIHPRDKVDMRRKGVTQLGDAKKLKAEAVELYERKSGKQWPKRKNRGWVAEYAVFKNAGKAEEWFPNNREFWLYPDMELCGNTYQIKSEDAEYFNESNLEKARRWEKAKGL